MYTMCMPGALKGQGSVGASGTGITGGCEVPWGCWEPNPGPLEEQRVLLATEPSLQPQHRTFFKHFSVCLQLCNNHRHDMSVWDVYT